MGKAYTFCVHDESVNTYGFRMLTSGANLEEFKKNPVVLYNHNDWETPIGRGENVRVEDGRILVDVVFDEEDEKGCTIAGKVERGFLRMASIGAWPPEEVSDDPALKLPGQTGPTATRWTMREMSVCPIGSNHNALAMYDRATNKRIDLSDRQALVRLMDKEFSINHKRENNMSYLTQMLKLSRNAPSLPRTEDTYLMAPSTRSMASSAPSAVLTSTFSIPIFCKETAGIFTSST